MGRKPKAAKVAEEPATTAEDVNPTTEIVEPQTKSQLNSNLRQKSSAITRRSARLQHVASPAQNKETEPGLGEINLCESDKEDELPLEDNHEPMPVEKSLEEKMSYVLQAVEELKSKAAVGCPRSNGCATDLKYKSMYIDSQKKIEELTSENYELSKQLEVALAKSKAYEEASHVCSELLSKLKDVVMISNLVKATETAINLSSQAVFCQISSPGGNAEPDAAVNLKRKKSRK
ncbi:hypothetical protein NMG60_11034847 [Bertholletia excelsa]